MATDWTPLPTPPTTWGVLIGQGNVVGPDTATDNAIARFDGETGKCIQNSGVIIDDSDNITGVTTLAATGLIASNTQLTAGVDDDTQGLIYAYGALTDDGGTVRLYTAGNSDSAIEYYGLRANEDDFEFLSAAVVKLTYKAEDEWQFFAPVLMDGTDAIQFNDAAVGINSPSNSNMNVFADGSIALTSPNVTVPTGTMSIGANDTTAGQLAIFGNAGGTGGAVLVYNSANEDTTAEYYGISANEFLEFTIAGTAKMVLSSAGLVGIGTVAPQQLLHTSVTRTTGYTVGDQSTWSDVHIHNLSDTVGSATGISFIVDSGYHVNAGTGIAAVKGAGDFDADMVFITRPPSAPSVERMRIMADGGVGIGTTTVPHGGIGDALLALEGASSGAAGPNIQFTITGDNYPLLQIYPFARDDVGILFDAYGDAGVWKSSDATSNFIIRKQTDLLRFGAESGIAQGAAVTWAIAFQIEPDAEVMFSPGAALKTYHRDANAWTYSPAASILELSAASYVRVGAGTTSHSLSGHGDFLVSGLLEVNGIAHFDENLNMSKTGALVLSMTGTTYNRFSGNDGGAVTFEFGSQNGYDACNLLTGAAGGLQWIVGDTLWWNNDFDHAALAYPVMYFQSSQNPNVSNNEHGSWAHNGADFVCGTGVETGTGSAPTTIDNGIMFSPRGVEAGRFEGSGDFLVSTDKKWQFRDPEIYINSGDNGYLDLVADTGFRFNTGSVDIFSGVLTVGVSSVQSGYLVLAGHATGSAQGGQINLNTAYDYTGTVVFYTVAVNQADLVFGATGSPKLTYKGSEDRWDFATHLTLPDDVAAKFGTGQDADFFYGSDAMNIVTDIVAPSDLIIDCGTAKTMELAEPVFRDDNFGSARVTLGATAPSWDTFTDNLGADTEIDCLAFAVGDEVTWTTEIQHDYAQGEDFYLHVHYQCDAAPSGTDQVAFEFDYTIVRDGVTMPPVTNIGTDDCAVDTRYAQYRCDTIAISGTGIQIGDQLSIRMERVAAAGDAYAGVTKLKTAGTHYPVNTLGSRTVGVK